MSRRPLFSIVTPHRNYAHFLKRTILGVREQVSNLVQIEHLVIDACSSDGAVDWLRAYTGTESSTHGEIQESGYTFKWISEPDKGQTDAINKGLRMSTGDIVCWLNSDEYYMPDALENIAKTFHENPKIDLVYGEPLFVDSNNNPIRIKRDHRFDRNILLYYGCYISSCCTFWRRHILESGNFLDDSYRVTMDFEYWVRLAKEGYGFLFIPKVIAAFTWHPDNVSSVLFERRRKERLKVQFRYAPQRFKNIRLQTAWLDWMARLYRQKRRFLIVCRKIGGSWESQA